MSASDEQDIIIPVYVDLLLDIGQVGTDVHAIYLLVDWRQIFDIGLVDQIGNVAPIVDCNLLVKKVAGNCGK